MTDKYARLIYQKNFKYQRVFSVRLDKQDIDDQV